MKLTEEQIRKIALDAINQLGDKASPDTVKRVVMDSVNQLSPGSLEPEKDSSTASGRVIITSFGFNEPGVVASITKSLSEAKCDIQDISQKIMGDFFTMIMIVDITNSPSNLMELQEEMKRVAESLEIKIYLQHEEVFRQMHRL